MNAHSLWSSIIQGLFDPLRAFVDPTKRAFCAFLLGAGIIATAVWRLRLRDRCSWVAFLFPKKIWLHRSALLDYRLLVVRAVIHATLFAPFAVSAAAVALAIARWLWAHVGILPRFETSGTVVMALFTVSAFAAQDLARYTVHRLAHRVPALWELHKVHHSAEVLTPFTVYRTHPIESVIMRGGAALAIGVVAGVLSWLFPGKVSGWAIMGVDAPLFVWNALGSNLRHSQVWLSYGPVLEHIFISPAQHQIHHSDAAAHYDSNFGSTLAIWDWLGKTLRVTRRRETLRFGLPREIQNHAPTVRSALTSPLWAALRQLTMPVRSRYWKKMGAPIASASAENARPRARDVSRAKSDGARPWPI